MTATPATAPNSSPALTRAGIVRPDEPRHFMVVERIRGTVTARVGEEVVASSARALRVREFFGRELEPVLYFPPGDVRGALLTPTGESTVCPLKGTAASYDIATDPAVPQGAWSYQHTHDFDRRLAQLECCVAFDRQVVTIEVSEDAERSNDADAV